MDITIIAIIILFLISAGRLYSVKDFADKFLSALEVLATIIVLVTTQL